MSNAGSENELAGIENLAIKQILNNQCSQINIGKKAEETYLGYCFFSDGSYCSPVHLDNIKQAARYFDLQKIFQHRVIIVDAGNSIIAEAIDGVIVFPRSK